MIARLRREEDGIVLVWFAMLLLVLMGFAAFAVDLGYWYLRGQRLQRAADAAALAGAVYMPNDFPLAEATALESLRRNGIDPDADDMTVAINPVPGAPYQLNVTVRDADVEAFFAKPFLPSVTETRTATGEYVLPVPLGSPTNYIGTGTLLSGAARENITAAVNGYCTAKEDGDLVLSRYDGTKAGSPTNRCPDSPPSPSGYSEDNRDYHPGGYSYYVELPPARPQAVVVALYDAPYYTSSSSSPDLPLMGSGSAVTTTFRLRAPDNTPLDDRDNPVYACGGTGETNPRTFTTNQSGVFNLTIQGSSRWTRFCTIPPSAPAGRYLLEVATSAGQAASVGVNAYGVFLQRDSLGSVCDSRISSGCPRVYGKDRLSVFARQAATTGQFFLAEVDAVHAGKKMIVSLWDPGEGGSTIEIIDPAGNPVRFDYRSADGHYGGSNVDVLDVSGTGPQPGPNRGSTNKFNDRSLVLTVNLPADYATRYASRWWRIRYRFTSGTVSDRTTWSVQIVGDPVHLVNEG